jgi:hypothetical protein
MLRWAVVVIVLLLGVVLVAGCGGEPSFDWRDVKVEGGQLVLPDGTTITVRVMGTIPPACDFGGPLPPLLDKCLPITTKHGCRLQTFRIDETNEPFRIEETNEPVQLTPPHEKDQHALVLWVPVAPDACVG